MSTNNCDCMEQKILMGIMFGGIGANLIAGFIFTHNISLWIGVVGSIAGGIGASRGWWLK